MCVSFISGFASTIFTSQNSSGNFRYSGSCHVIVTWFHNTLPPNLCALSTCTHGSTNYPTWHSFYTMFTLIGLPGEKPFDWEMFVFCVCRSIQFFSWIMLGKTKQCSVCQHPCQEEVPSSGRLPCITVYISHSSRLKQGLHYAGRLKVMLT